MKIQVEVSIYPLKTMDVTPPINTFCKVLEQDISNITVGPMSTRIFGESDVVFPSIQRAFESVADAHSVVMALKCSNACPERK